MDLSFNYLALAIPLFLLLTGLEYYLSKRKGNDYFQYSNSVANLSIGIAERLLDLFVVGIFYQWYTFVHEQYALFTIQPGILPWILLFIATDLIWYWYHRAAHEINLLWSIHVVHHQSEDFNFTVAARITVFQAFIRTGFWSLLPFIGFPAPMISLILIIHGIYPFFLHTQVIGRLGWLEYLFVTPSHHRVHHASNEEYLDKNYGDVLIIWDKLFGTFTTEQAPPTYGLTKPLQSKSFLWQHFHFALELFAAVKATSSFRNKFRLLFGKPDLIEGHHRNRLEKKWLAGGNFLQPKGLIRHYINAQLILSLSLLFGIYLLEKTLPQGVQLIIAAFLLATLINIGAILEQRLWIFCLEYIRFLIVVAAVAWYYPSLLGGLGLFIITSALYFNSIQKRYLNIVFG